MMKSKLLHEACKDGNHVLVKTLLSAGARTDVKDFQGNTPEKWCSSFRQSGEDCRKLLMEREHNPLSLLHLARNTVIKCIYETRMEEKPCLKPYGNRFEFLGNLPAEILEVLNYNRWKNDKTIFSIKCHDRANLVYGKNQKKWLYLWIEFAFDGCFPIFLFKVIGFSFASYIEMKNTI